MQANIYSSEAWPEGPAERTRETDERQRVDQKSIETQSFFIGKYHKSASEAWPEGPAERTQDRHKSQRR